MAPRPKDGQRLLGLQWLLDQRSWACINAKPKALRFTMAPRPKGDQRLLGLALPPHPRRLGLVYLLNLRLLGMHRCQTQGSWVCNDLQIQGRPKALGFGIATKHNVIGHALMSDPKLLGLTWPPYPKGNQKLLGMTWSSDLNLLGLACIDVRLKGGQKRLGLAWPLYPRGLKYSLYS